MLGLTLPLLRVSTHYASVFVIADSFSEVKMETLHIFISLYLIETSGHNVTHEEKSDAFIVKVESGLFMDLDKHPESSQTSINSKITHIVAN